MARVDPFKAFEAALPAIIAENPSQIMRYREVAADTFSAPVTYTAGSYTVRIERAARTAEGTWDEKGGVAALLFEMVGHNLPRTITHGGKTMPLFQVDDIITDQDGNRYRVIAPQYVKGKMVQVSLELRG